MSVEQTTPSGVAESCDPTAVHRIFDCPCETAACIGMWARLERCSTSLALQPADNAWHGCQCWLKALTGQPSVDPNVRFWSTTRESYRAYASSAAPESPCGVVSSGASSRKDPKYERKLTKRAAGRPTIRLWPLVLDLCNIWTPVKGPGASTWRP